MTSPAALKVLPPFAFTAWTLKLTTETSPIAELAGAKRLHPEKTSRMNNDKEVWIIFFISISFS
jgi:hypothetical protein